MDLAEAEAKYLTEPEPTWRRRYVPGVNGSSGFFTYDPIEDEYDDADSLDED